MHYYITPDPYKNQKEHLNIRLVAACDIRFWLKSIIDTIIPIYRDIDTIMIIVTRLQYANVIPSLEHKSAIVYITTARTPFQ